MPHIDGFKVAQYIRTSPSNSGVPIVLLTGYDDVETMRAGFRAGITFFQPKPINTERLIGLLNLMRSAMARENRSYVRLPLEIPVTCKRGNQTIQSTALNISETGMMLDCSGGIGPGKVIELRFSLPGSSVTMRPRAIVVRVEPGGRMAVQFTGLEASERKAIQGYIVGTVGE